MGQWGLAGFWTLVGQADTLSGAGRAWVGLLDVLGSVQEVGVSVGSGFQKAWLWQHLGCPGAGDGPQCMTCLSSPRPWP